jgi:uncharacterized membrane protein YhhN
MKTTNRWPGALPWTVTLCATLAITAASGGLPAGLAYVFKPLTTLLILAHAWPRGSGAPRRRALVRAGLMLSLLGDVLLMWPVHGFLPGLVAFLLAHLVYIGAFCLPVSFAARPLPFAAYGVAAGLILAALWPGVPAALRLPVLAYVACLASMAAQAAVWWRSHAHTPEGPLARSAALGGLLFFVSDGLLAVNKFGTPLPLSALWILASYWAAQWCIAGSLGPATARPAKV